MEQDTLLEIRNLYTNFYTYQGVVKALDGIDFTIGKGETFGLVGETGCGKSVTANCVMRLIPIPPGKIEKGNIYFMAPTGSDKEIADVQARIASAKAGTEHKEGREARIKRLEAELNDLKEVRRLKEEIAAMNGSPGFDPKESRYVEANMQLDKIKSRYDLLARSEDYMRKIRGKYISMIFQEPMSALNPVFQAGEQIAEVIILHEKKELAQAVLRHIDARKKEIGSYRRASVVRTEKGEFRCTNCNAIMAMEQEVCPQCGVSFNSQPLRGLESSKLSFYRRFYIAMADDPDKRWLRWATKVPFLRRYQKLLKEEALNRAEMMLRLVRIPDPKNVIKSYPHELSGGMQQRVMIAMAMACKPQILIADEPTTALDVTIQAQILKLMRDLQEETGTSILLITHNLGVVAETCNRLGVMYAGVMAEIGPVQSIFKEPLHPYTQGLLNSIPKITMGAMRLEIIEGNVPNLVKPPNGCRFNPRCPYTMEICKKVKPPMVEIRPGHSVACHLYLKGGVS